MRVYFVTFEIINVINRNETWKKINNRAQLNNKAYLDLKIKNQKQ